MARSLILAAHGSLAETDSNQPLFDLAARIASHEKFDIVVPAFLNGQPEMTNVLDRIHRGDWTGCKDVAPNTGSMISGEVVIVPVMTSEGYYLRKLPSKFAENESLNEFQVSMTPVIGVHDSIQDRIAERVSFLLDEFQLTKNETTVAIIGHGTRRNPNSGTSTLELTVRLRETFAGSELTFKTGFLDQDPEAGLIAQEIQTPNTLIIPFLISRGPHTTQDIPEAFSFHGGPDLKFPLLVEQPNRKLVYDFPLALYPKMDELCLELAIDQFSVGKMTETEPTVEFKNPNPVSVGADSKEGTVQ